MPVPCATFMDHDWETVGTFVPGKHPTTGRYIRRPIRCKLCLRESQETIWLTLTPVFSGEIPPTTKGPQNG
jgi:hypothetical protein